MKRTIFLTSLAFVLILCLSAAYAENNLTAADDEATFDSIQQKIDDADNSTVIELEGTYGGNSASIHVDKKVTIRGSGSGATLNGRQSSRIMDISADDVVLENLVFINGDAKGDYGGAVYAKGNNIRIVNCTFTSNGANYGAAIATSGAGISISDCRFSKNVAQYSGAVEVDGDNTILTRSVFENNAAGHVGAAVAWVGANGVLSDSVFDNYLIDESKSAQFGGAVVWMGANGTLTKSTIRNFISKKMGAAVYWKGTLGRLEYCIIEDNNSPLDDGYYGNPEYVSSNYWGENIASSDDFISRGLVFCDSNSTSPDSWVNIVETADSIRFASSSGVLKGYLPDYSYKGIVIKNNVYVILKQTKITAASLASYANHAGKSLKVTLKDASGNALSNKRIQIRLGNALYNAVTDAKGVAWVKVSIRNAGIYVADLVFAGDASYGSSSATVKITVKKQKLKITVKKKAKGKKVRVTLKDQFKKPVGKKQVKIKIGKKSYKSKTSKKGIAVFKVKLKAKKAYVCKVNVKGDRSYMAYGKKFKIRIV